MKTHHLSEIAERLQLPAEAFGAPLLSLCGRRAALIENVTAVTAYSSELIEVKTAVGTLRILGRMLVITAMDRRSLALSGELQSVEWD